MINFSKYGIEKAVSPQGGALDFSKYGIPINSQSVDSPTIPFRYDVAETRAEKIQRFQQESSKAETESKKANSLMERYVKPVASAILPGSVELGETLSGIKGTEEVDQYTNAIQRLTDTQINLIRGIREGEKKGNDVTKLKRIYNSNIQALDELQSASGEITKGSEKSTKRVIGELAMNALSLLTAGTYGKSTVGTKSFTLGQQAPTAIKEVSKVLSKPSGLFTLRGASDVALGAGIGEAFDIAQNLQEDKKGMAIFADGYAKYIGAGIPTAFGLSKSVAGRFSSQAIRSELGDAYRKTSERYVKPQTILERAETKHKSDPIGVLELYGNKTIPEMAENGGINPTNSIEFLDNKIGELSELKKDSLFVNNDRVNFKDFRNYANDLVSAQNWTDDYSKSVRDDVNKIIDDLERGYEGSVKNKDGLELLEWDKIKTKQTGDSKSYKNKNPKFQYDAHGIVGKAAREIVELFTDDIEIRDLNKFIQSHYDAIDFLDALKGKTPKGGVMSKNFAKVGGDIIGFAAGQAVGHPFLGAMSGRYIASQLTDIVQSRFISNPIKRLLIRNLKEQTPSVVKKAEKLLDDKIKNALDEIMFDQTGLDNQFQVSNNLKNENALREIEQNIEYANKQGELGMWSKADAAVHRAVRIATENDIDFPIEKLNSRVKESYESPALTPDTKVNKIPLRLEKNQNKINKRDVNFSEKELNYIENPVYFSQGKVNDLPNTTTRNMSSNMKPTTNVTIDDTIPPMTYLSQAVKEGKDIAQAIIDYAKNPKLGMSIEDVSKNAYKGERDLTTKILKDLEGKTTVSKQYILDATNRGELKQVERDLIREALTNEGDTINVADFAKKVKTELLPLKIVKENDAYFKARGGRYENVTLPDELRGRVEKYTEHIYESPIKTSAGNTHYSGISDNYFGHTRIEDLPPSTKGLSEAHAQELLESGTKGTTRRVIEVQSDLYQKGRLDDEKSVGFYKNFGEGTINREIARKIPEGEELIKLDNLIAQEGKRNLPKETVARWDELSKKAFEKEKAERLVEISKLSQYNDPTAHFRMIREEIKKAAQDGKTRLQFPTGETAMKIEGLGENTQWFEGSMYWSSQPKKLAPEKLKIGEEIYQSGAGEMSDSWIITDVLGDGKFKAVPKETIMNMEDELAPLGYTSPDDINFADKKVQEALSHQMAGVEQFDISGKVDTNNPIYKFYEKDMQKYLSKFGGKRVVDDKGVSWIEVPIKKEWGNMPVEAFALAPLVPLVGDKENKSQNNIERIKNEIAFRETGVSKEPYSTIGITGDLGKYQVNPETLSSYSKKFLGKEVSSKEFLATPALQEKFIENTLKHLSKLGAKKLDTYLVLWHKGWGDVSSKRIAELKNNPAVQKYLNNKYEDKN